MEEKKLNEQTRNATGGTFIRLTDGWTHYELSGPEGTAAVVLVHGNAAPMLGWDNNVGAMLNAGFRVLRYDIYGHGFSDRPDMEAYNKSLYIRQLSELTERLGVRKPFHLAGTSQGGSIAACYAAAHPDNVSKLALLAPLFDEFSGMAATGLMKSRFGNLMMSVAKEKTFLNPERVLFSDAWVEELREKLRAQLQFEGKKRAVLANLRGDSFENLGPCYGRIAELAIPVFLSWGENDRSIPLGSIARLRKLIQRIEYHQISRAGHLAHYELPEIINPLLIKFFTG